VNLAGAAYGIIAYATFFADELTEALQLLNFQGFFLPPSKAIPRGAHNLLGYKLAPSILP
jgi:hypothetical protein